MIKKVNKRDNDQVKVTFVLPGDHSYGEEVYVAGDFNDWDTEGLKFIRRSNHTYSTNVLLDEGERYAFRYYSEESGWINEGDADDYEHNEFGETNCIVVT